MTVKDRPRVRQKPDRPADLELFGEGPPPRTPPGTRARDVAYWDLFFEAMPSSEYPRDWWAARLWRKAARTDVQSL